MPSSPDHISSSGMRQRKGLPEAPSHRNFASPGMNSIRNRASLQGVDVTAEEADAILQQLADKDTDNKKTWSRVFVERFLLDVSF